MSRVASNSVWQLVSFSARAVSGLGVVILLAQAGGPESLGLFQFALVLTAMVPYFFGLPSLLAREVARTPERGRQWIEGCTLISLIFGAAFTVAFAGGVRIVGVSPEMAAAVTLASLGMAFDGVARVQFAAFWAWEQLNLEAAVTIVQEAALIGGVALVTATGRGVLAALAAFLGSRALGAVIGWALVSRRLGSLALPRADVSFLRGTLRESTPFAMNDTLTLAYMRADTVLLGIFKGQAAVGLYQAGTNLVLNLNVLARSINRALYPRMSRAWPGRQNLFRRLQDMSFRSISLIAVPVMVGSILLASDTFDFLYGVKFQEGVLAYQLLALIIPVRMLGHTLSMSLAATDRQKQRMYAVLGATTLNLGLNLVFIPLWSFLGAAIATMISETGLLVAYSLLLLRVGGGPASLLHSLSLPALASLPMGGLIVGMRGAGLVPTTVAGALLYTTLVLIIAVTRVPADSRRQPRAVIANLVGSGS